MASPSERLAELRAALRELEACVAQLQAKEAAARGYDPREMTGVHAGAGAGAAEPSEAARGFASAGAIAHRVLRPPLRALAAWWQRSRTKEAD